MKLREVDRSQELNILLNCIISTEFLSHTHSWLKETFFDSNGARRILRWCLLHYEEYETALDWDIYRPIEVAIKNNELDEEEEEYIEKLMGILQAQHRRRTVALDVKYHVDLCRKFCEDKVLEQGLETAQNLRQAGRNKEARELLQNLPAIGKQSRAYQPFSSPENARNAFNRESMEMLIHLPGALGKMMNTQFYRGSFVGFLAIEKAGKSFFMQELAMRAWFQGRNVVVFEAGDLTPQQRDQRMFQYMCALPNDRNHEPGELIEVLYPVDFEGNFETWKLRNIDGELAAEGFKTYMRRKHFAGGSKNQFHVIPYSNSTLDSKLVRQHLEELKREFNFTPDIIIDDYMDIHAPEGSSKEFRHQENEKWKSAAAIRLEYKCCYITCTQANAKGYDIEWLSKNNFSEDKRKYAHVTAMFGINRTDADREKNIIRINDLGFTRDRDKAPSVVVLQCLALGRPYLASKWFNPVDKEEEEQGQGEGTEPKRTSKKKQSSKPKSKSAQARELLKRGLTDVAEIAKETGLSKGSIRDLQTELRKKGELGEDS